MPEKCPEKCVLEHGKPIGKGVLRLYIQGKLIAAGVKGLSVNELKAELMEQGYTIKRQTVGKVIAELTEMCPPFFYVQVVNRRTGEKRIPTNFYYIVRYTKKDKTV